MKKYIYEIYENFMYHVLGIIIYGEDKFRKHLKNNGFHFPQGEYCVRGVIRIEFDFYPYLIESDKNSKYFTTKRQFRKFIKDN